MGRPRKTGQRFLAEANFQIAKLLCREGATKDRSLELGEKIVTMLRNHFGGETVYFPSTDRAADKKRNAEIYAEFNAGSDYSDLAMKYELTTRMVRIIVSNQKAQMKKSGAT